MHPLAVSTELRVEGVPLGICRVVGQIAPPTSRSGVAGRAAQPHQQGAGHGVVGVVSQVATEAKTRFGQIALRLVGES